jgi:hypothetical protein
MHMKANCASATVQEMALPYRHRVMIFIDVGAI